VGERYRCSLYQILFDSLYSGIAWMLCGWFDGEAGESSIVVAVGWVDMEFASPHSGEIGE